MRFSMTVKQTVCGIAVSLSVIACFWFSAAAEEKNQASDLIAKAWDAQGKRQYDKVLEYTQKCIDLYKQEGDRQHASLNIYPTSVVEPLTSVALAYFIQAEALMRQQKWDESMKKFQFVIDQYRFVVAFDPSRGVFWKVAGVAQESIDKIKIILSGDTFGEESQVKFSFPKIPLTLFDGGAEEIVDYGKYGVFSGVGTREYAYVITDQQGLSKAVGEGIYPNSSSIKKDPLFIQLTKEKRLEGSHWDYVNSHDYEAAFLKWATAPEPPGVRLFYTGLILEKAGFITQALKCYYAIIIHFPGSYGWTYWHTPWYVGQAAIAKINFLLRRNPSLGYRLEGADITVINGFDQDVSNDVVITKPGRFVKTAGDAGIQVSCDLSGIERILGTGRVNLVQLKNGDWQLMVDKKPYVIKGVTYNPVKVGMSPDEGTLSNWMEDDLNRNGKTDGPFDAFVDKNRNNIQDKDEPPVGDFALMKAMGVNTLRIYHSPTAPDKELLRELYKNYGIMVIMSDFLGKYTIGSGASWNPGTDYRNEEHKKNMLQSVKAMVREFKDEPYILFWLLGNENVYGVGCNADKEPDVFFKFANEVAQQIKAMDLDHPVALCGGDVLFLDRFAVNAPDIDIFGTNAYRGGYGFGYLWRQVKELTGKPAFITEYGCPAYAEGSSLEEAESMQAEYHRGCWEDIELNMAESEGVGNALGGVVFEWLDEWWKAYEPWIHDRKGYFTGPFPDGYMHEEWLGLCGQGKGKMSPYLRHLREAYFMYKAKWNKSR